MYVRILTQLFHVCSFRWMHARMQVKLCTRSSLLHTCFKTLKVFFGNIFYLSVCVCVRVCAHTFVKHEETCKRGTFTCPHAWGHSHMPPCMRAQSHAPMHEGTVTCPHAWGHSHITTCELRAAFACALMNMSSRLCALVHYDAFSGMASAVSSAVTTFPKYVCRYVRMHMCVWCVWNVCVCETRIQGHVWCVFDTLFACISACVSPSTCARAFARACTSDRECGGQHFVWMWQCIGMWMWIWIWM